MSATLKDVGTEYSVVLLDGNRLDVVAEPESLASQLLDVISARIGLGETAYFGLAYFDNMGNCHWLQSERQLGDHDLPQSHEPLVLYFLVRFFVPTAMVVNDSWSLILLYLHVRQVIWTGQLVCDIGTAIELASYVLQAVYGDYTCELSVKEQMSYLSLIPTCLMNESESAVRCEYQIVEQYKKVAGMSRGLAMFSYLAAVEKLPTYGIHYYKVKDKKGNPWMLGISWRGIAVYDHANLTSPRKLFAWKQLENIYFHEKKFSIEVVDPRNASAASPQSQDCGRVKVKVYTWLIATSRLTNTIWNMAVSEHQFYLEWKHTKSKSARLLTDIVNELDATFDGDPAAMSALVTETVVTFGSPLLDQCPPSDTSIIECGQQLDKCLALKEAEAAKAAQALKYNALKERKSMLEERLQLKLEQLYDICAKEAEITGVIPVETPRIPGKLPLTIRKKLGTEFTISPQKETGKVGELEVEFEIQTKQMEAALKLSQDKSLARNVRRKYRQQYRDAHLKLKELEQKLNLYRRQVGRSLINIPETVEDPDDLLLSPQVDNHPDSAGETGSLASQQSCQSEGQGRSRQNFRRSKSVVPPTQLNHLSGSLPKMEIQEYNKAPVLRSPIRSVSSNSLKDSSSPAEPTASEIKIYPKMVHRSINSPQVNPQIYGFNVFEQQPYSIPSSVHGDSGISSSSSCSNRRTSRRQIRVNSQKHPPSPNPSERSDVSNNSRQTTGSGSGGDGIGVRRGSSKFSVASGETCGSSCTASTAVVGEPFQDSGTVFDPAAACGVTYPESYEEQTRTWPRKRGNRSSRRRPSDDVQEPDVIESAGSGMTPVTTVVECSPSLNESLDLAELSPSKYGCKRDSVLDAHDSPFFAATANLSDLRSPGSCYGSDPNFAPNQFDSRTSGRSSMSQRAAAAESAHVHHSKSSRRQEQQTRHNVSIVPLQWEPAPHPSNADVRAEHILLSQGRRQTPPSASNRQGGGTPADCRTIYEPYRYSGVSGGSSNDSFSSPPGYAGGHRPATFYQHPSTPSAAIYSPNLAAGRSPCSAPSASSNAAINPVDMLFNSLFSTNDSPPYAPAANPVRPAPHQSAPHWTEPSIRSQGASNSSARSGHDYVIFVVPSFSPIQPDADLALSAADGTSVLAPRLRSGRNQYQFNACVEEQRAWK